MLSLLPYVDSVLPWPIPSILNLSLVIAASAVALVYLYQAELIYPANIPVGSRRVVATPAQFDLSDWDDVTLTTTDGVQIKAYAIYNRRSTAGSTVTADGNIVHRKPGDVADYTVLYCHANAGNMGHRLPIAAIFHERLKVNVFMLSYRGYGFSQGKPSETGFKIDAETAVKWIREHPELGRTKLLVYGQSIGGAVAIHLASKYDADIVAMIVENTFLSIPKLVPHVLPIFSRAAFLVHQKWPSEKAITNVLRAPLLFLSGARDELVPPSHMYSLVRIVRRARGHSASNPADQGLPEREVCGVRFVSFANGTHNDTCLQEGYFREIIDFFADVVGGKIKAT
ncbi:Alpha/Beta hydrolase protein [Cladochytrium replicatum]|nr:Alpha/Beta hydrolase protein [Cladochytrium replicatum]